MDIKKIIKEEVSKLSEKQKRKILRGQELEEARMKKVTERMWKYMSDDKRFDALLSVVKDPSDAEKLIDTDWKNLPSGFERDMTIYEGKVNELQGKKEVVDVSYFGKFKAYKITDGKSFRVAIFKSKSLANKYNTNKQADIDKLWDLAKKYTGAPITEGFDQLPDVSFQRIARPPKRFTVKKKFTVDGTNYSEGDYALKKKRSGGGIYLNMDKGEMLGIDTDTIARMQKADYGIYEGKLTEADRRLSNSQWEALENMNDWLPKGKEEEYLEIMNQGRAPAMIKFLKKYADMKALNKYGVKSSDLKTLAGALMNEGKLTEAKKWKPKDRWSNDFDYRGMLKWGSKVKEPNGVKEFDEMKDAAESFTDVNYHSEAKSLYAAIDQVNSVNPPTWGPTATKHLKDFNKACLKALKGLKEGKLNEKYTGNPGDKLTHKHNKAISIELISPTNKGWKVYQIEKGKRKITHFNKQDITGPKAIFEGKLNEAKKYTAKEISKAWEYMYGEDLKSDYGGFYKAISKKAITKKELASIWNKMYGEDLKSDYGGFYDSLKEGKLNEGKWTVIDPRGNVIGSGMKTQANGMVKKKGGNKKGFFAVPAKFALKARRALEKARGNYSDKKYQDEMSDMYWIGEGKLNEVTAKDMLQHAVNALTKTFGGKKLDQRYVKEYLKSIEQMARKNPGKFVKDYGKFKFADWIEDVEYNLQNEGKLNEAKKYTAKEISKAWEYMYGEDLKSDYGGFYKAISKKAITKKELASIWNKMYGEDLKSDYGGFYDSLKEGKLNEGKWTVIDPRGNVIGSGMKTQANGMVKKKGGNKKGFFAVPAKFALKARRALEKARGNYSDKKYQDEMSDMYWIGEGKLNESMIGIKTKANFKPLQLKGALEKAGIKGFQMNRLSVTLTALKLDKKYFNDAKKIIDKLGLSVMMAKEGKLTEAARAMDWIEQYGEIGQIHKVRGRAAYVKFPSTKDIAFDVVDIQTLKKTGKKHKGKDLYLAESNINLDTDKLGIVENLTNKEMMTLIKVLKMKQDKPMLTWKSPGDGVHVMVVQSGAVKAIFPHKGDIDEAKTAMKILKVKGLKVIGELNERLDHESAMDILDAAAGYTSTAHIAASQQWWDAQALYDYLISDHIPKKFHKKFFKSIGKKYKLKETIDLRKIFMKGRKKKRTTDEGKITERLAKGLKPLLKLGSIITKKAGEAVLIKLSDKFDRIDDEYAGEIASWLDMAIELMQDGYPGDATKKLKQFNKKCKDVLKGKSIKSAFAEGKLNEGKISVADESRFGKFLSIKLTDGKSFRVAIFKSQSLANKYNRNKQADIDKLWDLAKKYTGAVIKEAEYGTPTGTKTLKSIDAKFDDAVFKVPPHKITRDWVLKIAKKYKVDPKKAIEWVNLNPKINIKEGKSTKVKDKVNERLNSQKLRSLLAVLNNELIEMPWVKTDSGTLQKTLEKAIMKAVKEKTLSEGKLNEATAKQILQHAVNALTKTIPGRKLDKNYVKKYLKSIEQIARRKPQDFVKDYGKFKFADWIEDVEYNMQNEGKISTKKLSEIIIEEYEKLSENNKAYFVDLKSISEELRPDELEKLATDLAHSMPNHTKYDDKKGPTDLQILAAMKKYYKDLFQHSTTSQKKQAIKIVKKVLSEGVVTEAKIKHIDIWFEDRRGGFYKVKINGGRAPREWDGWSKAQDSLSKLLGWEIHLRSMDDNKLEKAAKELKRKGIKLTWDDTMDVS